MDDRKFYTPGIVLGVLTFGLSFFCLPVESIAAGTVSVFLSIKSRKAYRTRIGVWLTVVGLLSAISFLIMMVYMGITGLGAFDYWFFELLF